MDFVFPKRLARLGYIWRILLTNATVAIVLASAPSPEQVSTMLGLLVLFGYQFFFVLLPRVRDTGMSGWWGVA